LSAVGTFVVTVGLALVVLVAFYLMYYLSTIAGRVYDIKVQTIRRVEERIEELRGEMDRELTKRSQYLSKEARNSVNGLREGMEADTRSLREAMDKSIEAIREELDMLKADPGGETGGDKATGADGKVAGKPAKLNPVKGAKKF